MKPRILAAVALILAAAPASADLLSGTMGSANGLGFPVIVDTDEPQEGPLVINGCELVANGACPGADTPRTEPAASLP